jgi:hypothetical protein
MEFKSGSRNRGDDAVVRGAISAIRRGDRIEHAVELNRAIDMHISNEPVDGQFYKTFLRVTRLNMSPRKSERLCKALKEAPDQKALTLALSKDYNKLDMALALNNMSIASSVTERMLDLFDGLAKVKKYDGRFGNLEHEIGARLTTTDWAKLKYSVIYLSAHIGVDPIAKTCAVGSLLGLGQRGEDQLLDLYLSVVDDINVNLNLTWQTKGLSMVMVSQREGMVGALDAQLADEFGITLKRIFEEEGVGDKANIKAVVVYPLIISVLNPRRKRDFGLSDALIRKIVDLEPDMRLRSMIEQMDHAVSPDQKKKN